MCFNRLFKDLGIILFIILACVLFSFFDQSAFVFSDMLYKLNLIISIFYLALALLCSETFGIKTLDLSRRLGIIYIVLSPFRFYQIAVGYRLANQSLPISYMMKLMSFVIILEALLLLRAFNHSKQTAAYAKELSTVIGISGALLFGYHFLLRLFVKTFPGFLPFSFFTLLNLVALIISFYLFYYIRRHKDDFSAEMNYYLLLFGIFYILHKLFIFNINSATIIANACFRIFFTLLYTYFLFMFVKTRVRTITIKDLTSELITSEKQLKQTLKDMQNLIYFLPEAACICSEDTLLFANKKFMELFHISDLSQIVNQKMIDIIPPDIYPYSQKGIDEFSLEESLPVFEVSFDSGGYHYDIEVSTTFIHYNSMSARLGLIKDLSDKREREKLSAELIRKDCDEQIKNEFLNIISHEFKTPVNVIYSALSLQEINIETVNITGLHKCTKVIKQNCHRLMRLIGNLLDVNALQAGYITPCFKRCDIVEILENIYSTLKNTAAANRLCIHFSSDTTEAYLMTDKILLERILLNLVSNALKYSRPSGNLYMRIKTSPDELMIFIQDDGIGIPADKLGQIFSRFARIDNTLSRGHEGVGIGLYLVKGFVQLLHGEITLSSKENIGTEVVLSFKLSELDPIAPSSSLHDDPVSLSDKMNIEFSDIYL